MSYAQSLRDRWSLDGHFDPWQVNRQELAEEIFNHQERAANILRTAESKGRDLLASEKRTFDALTKEVDDLIAIREEVDSAVHRAFKFDQHQKEERRRSVEESWKRSGINIQLGVPSDGWNGRWMPTLDEYRSVLSGAETRTLTVAGGASHLAPVAQSAYMNAIVAASVVLSSGVQRLTIPNGAASLRVPVGTQATAVSTIAEGATITPADPTIASVTLDPVKLVALTKVSIEALDSTDPRIIEVVQRDHIRAMASAIDAQLLNGDGVAPNMTGLFQLSGSTTTPISGTDIAFDDILDAINRMRSNNLEPSAIYTTPALWHELVKTKASTGSSQYAIVGISDSLTGGVRQALFGVPVYLSTACLAAHMAVIDTSQVLVGEKQAIGVEVDGSRYFEEAAVAIRTMARYSLGVAHDEAVELINAT